MTKARGYNAEMDIFKFLFAMVIASFHLTHFGDIYLSVPETGIALIRLKGGYMATEFFFLVSGAMMAARVYRMRGTAMIPGETLRYCAHKYIGVLPVFILSLIISWVLGMVILKQNLLLRGGEALDVVWEALALHVTGTGHPFVINDPDWYLSALLLGCFIIYPAMRRYPDAVTYYVAPLISLLLFGYLVKTYGHLCVNYDSFTLVYPALLRAVGGLLLGSFAWQMGQRLRKLTLTALGRAGVTLMELACFVGVWMLCTYTSFSRNDMISLLLLAVLMMLLTSGQSALQAHLGSRLTRFLGSMSKAVFFSHYIVCNIFLQPMEISDNRRFLLYLLCVLALALVVLVLSSLCTRLFRYLAPIIKRAFIRTDGE